MNQLAQVPGVACGILEILKKKFNFENKLNFEFSLCYPKGTHGFPKNLLANSVQPYGQL